MAELLMANPTMYLDEIEDWLFNEWEIEVSVPTVHRCVKQLDLGHKKMERINPKQNLNLRALWLYKIASQYSTNQLIVVNKFAATKRTRNRPWG